MSSPIPSPSHLTRASLDSRIATLAATQFGLITAHQLHASGLSSNGIVHRVRAGRLHRIHPGVFAVGHPSLSRDARVMAAVLATGPESFASGACAAWLWRLYRRGEFAVEVTSIRRHRGLRDGATVRFSRNPSPRDIRDLRGIPIASAGRTIVELADFRTPYQVAHAIYEGRRRRLVSPNEVARVADRLRFRGSAPVIREALRLHRSGSSGTRSTGEDEFLARWSERAQPFGIELPLVNVRVRAGRRHIERDFRWPRFGIGVELDGLTHQQEARRVQDAIDDAAIRSLGEHVVRVRPFEIEQGISQVLEWITARRGV